jgi:hypothetical protein
LPPAVISARALTPVSFPFNHPPTDEKIGFWQMTSGRRVTGIHHHSAVAA